MPCKVVRNDIVRMECDAIVNTANEKVTVGTGCDYAIYQAAGREQLLDYRRRFIGEVPEGEAFVTPAFELKARYIIHAVSPCYIDGAHGEEQKLRSCYRRSLELAAEKGVTSIAFPLIAAGGFGYPKKEAIRIALDECMSFSLDHEMLIYLVLFGESSVSVGRMLYPDMSSYIDSHYVKERQQEEYGGYYTQTGVFHPLASMASSPASPAERRKKAASSPAKRSSVGRALKNERPTGQPFRRRKEERVEILADAYADEEFRKEPDPEAEMPSTGKAPETEFDPSHESALGKRMLHMQDTFTEYLLYLIESKGMTNAEVYNRGAVSKKAFSKIKNDPDHHPSRITALCLCIGAKLNMDETRDLLARAGYALSPSSKTDIIFSYFIENHIYNIYDLDIMLEEYGEPTLIA